jgi:hypothetical protein
MGQPIFRHSDCQLCIFLQPYICFNYYKNNTFFEFHFFFSFVQKSEWVSNDCKLYNALWRDWHQNIELNTLSEQRVLLWTEWNTKKNWVCPSVQNAFLFRFIWETFISLYSDVKSKNIMMILYHRFLLLFLFIISFSLSWK